MIINTFKLESDKLSKEISDLESKIITEATLGNKTNDLQAKMWALTYKYLKFTQPIKSRVVFV
jgi:hypothetical protein